MGDGLAGAVGISIIVIVSKRKESIARVVIYNRFVKKV